PLPCKMIFPLPEIDTSDDLILSKATSISPLPETLNSVLPSLPKSPAPDILPLPDKESLDIFVSGTYTVIFFL
ncbi:hypothetical protein AAEQ90_05280, partial [Pseudomonas aeruginosa]